MPVVEESIVIERPRSQVFAAALDPENLPLWASSLIEYGRVARSEGRVKEKTPNRGKMTVAGKTFEVTTEAVAFEEGRRVVGRLVEAQ